MFEESGEELVRRATEPSLLRRLLAEFVGTLLLVAVGAGAATVLLMGRAERFLTLPPIPEGGDPTQNEFFGALMETTFADVLSVAFAFALVLAVIVYAFGGVSGGHFNPAVTFALAVTRRFSWTHVPLYWVVQCAGGIAGAFVIAGIYGEAGAVSGNADIFFGGTVVLADDTWQAILAEAFITYILVTAIMAVAIDPRAPKGWSGIVIGLSLGAGILVTAASTGGSANFARSLGPFVASLPYDTGSIPWEDLIVYAIGPLIGGAAAALVYESVTGLEVVAPPPSPGAATPAEPEPILPTEPPVGATVGTPRPGEGQPPEHSIAPPPPPPPPE
jgi:glycerol uptake facilitator protein